MSEREPIRFTWERYDRCAFCGDQIDHLIHTMNICRDCYEGPDEEVADWDASR